MSSSSEESECYISPSLVSSTMVIIRSKKQLKKTIKKRKQQIDYFHHVRKLIERFLFCFVFII